jgi:hypothetical protein
LYGEFGGLWGFLNTAYNQHDTEDWIRKTVYMGNLGVYGEF